MAMSSSAAQERAASRLRQRAAQAAMAASIVLTALPAVAQETAAPEAEKRPSWFVMDERPSFRFGDVLRLDLTTRLDTEMRDVNAVADDAFFDFDHRRVGVEGRLFGDVGFEVERELHDDDRPWRDVFVEFRKWRALRVRGGRFKMPLGRERLTSIAELPFVYRSLPTLALTPARETGAQVGGRFSASRTSYAAGVFRHDGDVSRGGTEAPASVTFAGRLTVAPLLWARSEALRDVEAGVAVAAGSVPEGQNGLRARGLDGFEILAPHYVNGTRLRFSAEGAWDHGPFNVQGEYLAARDERSGQGLQGEDLPDVVGRGAYVSGSWVVVGALRQNRWPRRGLNDGAPGAIQLAARAEWLGFSSAGSIDGAAFRNPRAEEIFENDVRALTFGVNWYPVRFVRFQFNLVREHIDDPERRPDPSRATRYYRALRIQFAM
jgi:phosphate-selective porin